MTKDQRMANAFDPSKLAALKPNEQAMIERRQKALGQAYRLFYEHPVHFVRGEGVHLYDPEGNAYLDVYNNVASIGHSHPKVVEAIAKQAATLNTHTRYLNESILDYAEALLATFGGETYQAMFTCTGSEANDLAFRLARSYTGGTGIIVTEYAYHGVTSSVAECSPAFGPNLPLGIHVRTIPAPDTYHFDEAEAERRFLEGLSAAILDLQRHGIRPAALIVDTLFTSDGVYPEPVGLLAKAAKLIREAGGLLIADEVQAGFARSGSHFWGFQRHQVVPDIVTMGKPMGNGHPIAGLVAKPEIIDHFGKNVRYFNTFGGNPVSCAAGMAVLNAIKEEGLQENAAQVGAYLKAGFETLAETHALIGDVRGAGLFLGVEMVTDRALKTPAKEQTTWIVNQLRERRILISTIGPDGNMLKVRPQLPFSKANADQLLNTLDDLLKQL